MTVILENELLNFVKKKKKLYTFLSSFYLIVINLNSILSPLLAFLQKNKKIEKYYEEFSILSLNIVNIVMTTVIIKVLCVYEKLHKISDIQNSILEFNTLEDESLKSFKKIGIINDLFIHFNFINEYHLDTDSMGSEGNNIIDYELLKLNRNIYSNLA